MMIELRVLDIIKRVDACDSLCKYVSLTVCYE